MRLSVVNIQSTSVEFSAVEINDGELKTLLYDKEKLSVIQYVSNNKLLKKGYEKLKQTLEYYKELSVNLYCEKQYVISSDSLRNFNSVKIIDKIRNDLDINIISIDQYTECFLIDYANKNKVKTENSCLLDINGYGTQLIDLTRDKENFYLFDFGSLKVKYLYDVEDFNEYYDKLKKLNCILKIFHVKIEALTPKRMEI